MKQKFNGVVIAPQPKRIRFQFDTNIINARDVTMIVDDAVYLSLDSIQEMPVLYQYSGTTGLCKSLLAQVLWR